MPAGQSGISRPSIILAAIALLCLLPFIAAAQGPLVGGSLGYEFGVPLMLNRIPNAVNWCNCDGLGISYDHTVMGTATAIFPDLIANDLGLATALSFGISSGRFTSNEYDAGIVAFPGGTVRQRNRFTVDATSKSFTLDVQGRYRLGGKWWGMLGPSLRYRFAGDFVQRESIIFPDTMVFASTGLSERTIASGPQIAAPPAAIGLLAGISFSVPLSDRLSLLPTLGARLDLRSLRDGVGFRSISGGAGIALAWNSAVPPSPADSGRGDSLSPSITSPLSVALDMYAVDESGRRSARLGVLRRDILYRYHTPLFGTFFFPSGSAVIPERYIRLTRARAAAFTIDSLARLAPRALYSHALNAIGLTLRSLPTMTIRLRGSIAAGEPRRLAAARANAIRQYLVEIWGIERSRIVVVDGKEEETADDAPSAQSATVLFPAAASTLLTEWRQEDLRAAQIGLDPRFSGGNGVGRWEITIEHNERPVAHYSSDHSDLDRAPDLSLLVAESDANGGNGMLVAEIVAWDSAGAQAHARARLPLAVSSAGSNGEGMTRTVHQLVADDRGGIDSARLREIAGGIRRGDRLTLVRTGGGSREDAVRVADLLHALLDREGVHAGEIAIGDGDEERAEPGLPEDRFLSGVGLIVERGG